MNIRCRNRKTHVESLESRNLLAAASFSLQLYESGDDGPAGEIVGPVTAGDSFYVEVSAIEQDPHYSGIGGVAFNLKWDPSQIELVEEDFDLGEIFTDDLPAFRGGTYNQELGRIYDLRASQMEAFGLGRPVGDGQIESIVTLHFRSLGQVSEGEFRIWEGASEIVPASSYGNWQRSEIDFEALNLEFVAAQPTENEDGSSDGDGGNTEGPGGANSGEVVDPPRQLNDAPEIQETPDFVPEPVINNQPVDGASIDHVQTQPSVSASAVDSVLRGESSDQTLNFDMNQDGVFDFADFGLLNQAARTVEVVDSADTETLPLSEEAQLAPELDFHVFCIAAPARSDRAEFERWLDALAAAWIADADARRIEDEERRTSHQDTPSVLG